MPINKELLIQVRDRILAEPEHFDMSWWTTETECGTAGCIAGHAVAMQSQRSLDACNVSYWAGDWNYSDRARSILGLSQDQSNRLFCVLEWPEPFRTRHELAKPKRRAQVAADRIDLFLATEGAV